LPPDPPQPPSPPTPPSLPPSPQELFSRILSQINRSKRDILHDKYTQCKQSSTSVGARSVFIRVLKRIAESFISCLLNMQQNPSLQA
jgi:E1A/CREB-binding protein